MQRIIHQVWVGPYPMPKREQGYVQRMREAHPEFWHRLWTDENLHRMPELMPAAVLERFNWRMSIRDYAFAADILRIWLVYSMGGVYVDVDTDVREGFAGIPIRERSLVFRHHEERDTTLSNDFLGMEAHHPLGARLLGHIQAPAYVFGPHWLGASVREFYGLPPEAPHAELRACLEGAGGLYMTSDERDEERLGRRSWTRHFHNAALFSWSDDNRRRFAAGEYT